MWNDISQSLNRELQSKLLCKGEDIFFSDFVTLAIKTDNLIWQVPRRKEEKRTPKTPPSVQQHLSPIAVQASAEPLQLGLTRLSEEERTRRCQFCLCFYCGEAGHRNAECPHKNENYFKG